MSEPFRARKARGFHAPRPQKFAIWILRHFGGLYLRLARGTQGVRILNPAPLHEAFREFQAGSARLLIVFRHVEVADGPMLMHVLNGVIGKYNRSRTVRRAGQRLPKRPHAHFLYGKDVLDWAGAGARWVFPRLGGIPVVNTRLDRESHQAIRETILNGDYPLALAPEGQVTYQMFHVSQLTAGAGTMAHWIERDLVAEARRGNARPQQRILLLPLAVGYQFSRNHRQTLDDVIGRIEAAVGTPVPHADSAAERLLAATDMVLETVEAGYADTYPAVIADHAERFSAEGSSTAQHSSDSYRAERINSLCAAILRCAEQAVPETSDRTILRRLFAVRFRVLDMRFRPDVDPESLPPMKRRWADYQTVLAETLDRHAQLVDILMYIRPEYIKGEPSMQRLIEYALNVLDIANRVSGGNIDSRYSPATKQGRILVGEPIDAAEVLRSPGQTPKRAIQALNHSVYDEFVALSAELERRMVAEQPD